MFRDPQLSGRAGHFRKMMQRVCHHLLFDRFLVRQRSQVGRREHRQRFSVQDSIQATNCPSPMLDEFRLLPSVFQRL